MKFQFVKILVLFLSIIGLQGCYTILWTPDKKITDPYDTISYYGGYAPNFYDIPWWIDVPVIVHFPLISSPDRMDDNNDRNNERGTIRDNDGGRNPGGRNPDIINNPPPTVSNPGSSNPPSGSSSGSSGSGSSVRTESSGSSSSGSGNRSNDTRNDSGTRNSNSGRR
jgi:hypothetical protein